MAAAGCTWRPAERDGAPDSIRVVPIATTSAMVVSSVSPERCDTTADQPAPRASETPRWSRSGCRSAELDEDRVRRLFLDPARSGRVRHEQVVADELHRPAESGSQALPTPPIVPRGRPRATRSGTGRPSRPTGRPSRRSRVSGLRAPGRTAWAPSTPEPGATSSMSPGQARSRPRPPVDSQPSRWRAGLSRRRPRSTARRREATSSPRSTE